MEETGVRKCHSVTAGTARVIRRGGIGRYHWLRVEPRLKVILLSSTMAVLGACAFTGTSGGSLDSAGNTVQRTRAVASQSVVASQTVDECFAWDIACRLEQPVWLVAGPGDRGHEGSAGGGTSGSGPGGSGPGDSGTSDSGPGGSGPGDSGSDTGSDTGSGTGSGSDTGTDTGTETDGKENKGLGNGDENKDSADNGAGNTDPDNPGKGGG